MIFVDRYTSTGVLVAHGSRFKGCSYPAAGFAAPVIILIPNKRMNQPAAAEEMFHDT
jgi:hypothetical protein